MKAYPNTIRVALDLKDPFKQTMWTLGAHRSTNPNKFTGSHRDLLADRDVPNSANGCAVPLFLSLAT